LPHFCYLNVHRVAPAKPARGHGIRSKCRFSKGLGKRAAMVFKLHFP